MAIMAVTIQGFLMNLPPINPPMMPAIIAPIHILYTIYLLFMHLHLYIRW